MLPSLSGSPGSSRVKLHPVHVRLKGARACTWHDAAGQSAFDKSALAEAGRTIMGLSDGRRLSVSYTSRRSDS
jgi:hypothetical protein